MNKETIRLSELTALSESLPIHLECNPKTELTRIVGSR